MSRIGKLPIIIPNNVKVDVINNIISIKGPNGNLKKDFKPDVSILVENNIIMVMPVNNNNFSKAYSGTMRSIINSMVQGAIKNYLKNIELHGVGFKASLKENTLILHLGYSHIINYIIPYQDIKITIKDSNKISVEGPDKHAVGQVAADIYHFYPAEPYKGKGVRIIGKHIVRKEGKKTA